MKHIPVNIRRHSLSNKGEGGDCKKDYSITQEGWDLAVAEGKKLVVPEGGILAYSSPKNRAQETARGVLFGAYQANFRDREVDWSNVQTHDDLDSMAKYITKIPNLKQVWNSTPLDEMVNRILNEDPDAVIMGGLEIKRFLEYAVTEVHKWTHDKNAAKGIYNMDCDNFPVLVEAETHGPKTEAGLIAVTGMDFQDVAQIGGAFRETDYFSVDIEAKNFHEYRILGVRWRDFEEKINGPWMQVVEHSSEDVYRDF